MKILQMSVQAGLLITAVMIIRAVALNRLPKTSFLAMWGIALLRMLVPFSLSSKWSVYSIIEVVMKTIGESPTTSSNETILNLDSITQMTTQIEVMVDASEWFPLSSIVAIWLMGMCVIFLIIILGYFNSYRVLHFAVNIDNSEAIEEWLSQHKLRRPLKLLQSDRVTSPLTSGIISPRIILPKSMDITNKENIRYVLSHEYFHIRRFDMLWKLLMLFAVCIHWFNPMVWVMLIFFNRDLEITCDEMVLGHFGGDSSEKKAYACSLISMMEAKGNRSPLGSYFSKNVAEERITAIMKYKKASVFSGALALVIITSLTMAFAASPSDTGSGDCEKSIYEESIRLRELLHLNNLNLSLTEVQQEATVSAEFSIGGDMHYDNEIDILRKLLRGD